MAHCRCASVVLSAFAALHLPARQTGRAGALHGTADAGRLALRVVPAIALLAGHGIAREAVAVTLAGPAHVPKILRSAKVTGHTLAALVAPREVPAVDALRSRHRPLHQLLLQQLYRHFVHRVRIGHGHAVVDADPSVPVAVLETRHALAVVRGIADVERQTLLALRTHRVVVALQTHVELVRTGAIAVTVALTLNRAICADVTEIATAHVRLHAGASHAALRTHRHANFPPELVHPGGLGFVPVSASALETLLQIETFFAHR